MQPPEESTGSLWHKIQARLKHHLLPHVFHTYVESVIPRGEAPDSVELCFEDPFQLENFREKCLPAVNSVLSELSFGPESVRLELRPEAFPTTQLPRISIANPFDARFTFDSFVVGSSNQFAKAACQAVAKQPGHCYNPLFIFGGAGLGKTHLLKAIGHEIFQYDPKSRILFLTSESFTNELIQAIRMDRMREFRDKYRTSCTVLLIDDVHFFAGKERTQEEFFYTFNYLHESRRQIVITSDRYPKDIQGLENRLQTRFEWGLVADVQPPDIETRVAILKNKADAERIDLPDSVALFVASLTTNVRELEGSLRRLQAYASLRASPISIELAKQTLQDLTPRMKHELSPEGILKLTALQFNVRTLDLKSEKRTKNLTLPRQICMYLLRKYLFLSFPEIGRFLGDRDHTTVLHGVTKITELQRTDPEVLNQINAIESLIR